MSGPNAGNTGGKTPKVFTLEDFNRLKSRQASLHKQMQAKQHRIDELATLINSRSITRQMPDGTDPSKMHSVKEILTSGQVAAKRAERSLAKKDLAQLRIDLKAVDKDLKEASKQVGAAARQDTAVKNAAAKASNNPEGYLARVIKDLTEKSNGAFAELISRGQQEYAKNPAAFRGEIMAMMKEHFPTIHQLLLDHPELEDMVSKMMFGPSEDPK
jgi:hypothetical protein